ncbi:MAG: hypothetical protein WAV20_09020 [Blastocatellia bacterium]
MTRTSSLTRTRLGAVVAGCFAALIVLASCTPESNNNNRNSNVAKVPPAAKRSVAPVNLSAIDPFANSSTPAPPPSVYSGPLFQLNHNYPTTAPPPPNNPPWRQALNGQPISSVNAIAYTNALKLVITPAMKTLIFNYASWNAATSGWYNQPWLASIRDPIHGTYVGSQFPANTFTGQTTGLTTYVLPYYDSVAAYTLGQVWGQTALKPNITTQASQFPEGGIIIKLALVTASGTEWPAMQGAAQWPVYAPNPNGPPDGPPELINVYLMQCDIIVKDSLTSPKTGWVFTTLVFDNSVQGDAWDQMIPLGAMWGNDPDQNFAVNPAQLSETVINPDAPAYSTETLGWGGRLSGPNDGAVAAPGYVNGVITTVAASSCMSCHGVAEWPMQSFLLPSPPSVPIIDNALVVFEPGSTQWMPWFQDRAGTVPQDPGTVALDFDMVFAFKSLPAWQQATQSAQVGKLLHLFKKADSFRRGPKYNGIPER